MEKLTEFQLHKAIETSNAESLHEIYNLLGDEVLLDEDKKDVVKKSYKRFTNNKNRWFKSKKLKLDLKEYEKRLPNKDEVLFEYEPILNTNKKSTETKYTETTPEKRKKFKDLDRKNKMRRTQDIFERVQKVAEEEELSVESLLGFLLSRCEYRNFFKLGTKIFNGEEIQSEEIPLITALTIYCDCKLGRQTYTHQKRLLKSVNCPIFPSWSKLRKFQDSITPPVLELEAPQTGVYFPFYTAVRTTMVRIFGDKDIEFSRASEMSLRIKYGFDGSGSHSMYNQKNNVDTHNMILTVFCPLDIYDKDNKVWEETSPNTPQTQRPLMLQLGKEDRDAIEVQGMFNSDIKMMNEGILLDDTTLKTEVKTMYDRKASDTYMGLTGAYCDLCTHSKAECLSKVTSREFFKINRSIETMNGIFEDLSENGTIVKRNKDYGVRQGQIEKPIPENQEALMTMQVLHGMLRSFDHLMKLIVHVEAGIFDWSEEKSSNNHAFIKQKKLELQAFIFERLNQKWDQPDSTGKGGTTTQGNTVRIILYKNVQVLIDFLTEEHWKKVFERYCKHLAVVLRIISCSQKVNTQRFQQFCQDLYAFLVESFPRVTNKHLPGPTWISVTPTVHKVLAHSCELIELNGGFGLGKLDESGMEGCHKVLRSSRLNLARKTSQQANLVDTVRRLWISSDPLVNIERRKGLPWCKICSVRGHSTRYCRANTPSSPTESEDLFDYLTSE